jgi:hypothetical protein
LINTNSYSSCSEFYEIAKSVQFVRPYGGTDRTFKIEALFSPKDGTYSTAAYIQEHVTLQPSYPSVGNTLTGTPASYGIWTVFSNLGWTSRATAEAAIEQALGFLSQP